MMRPPHLRMARAALKWTLRELANKAGVNLNTVARYEAGKEVMSGTLDKIEKVFIANGVRFIEEGDMLGVTVRLQIGFDLKNATGSPRAAKTKNRKTKPK